MKTASRSLPQCYDYSDTDFSPSSPRLTSGLLRDFHAGQTNSPPPGRGSQTLSAERTVLSSQYTDRPREVTRHLVWPRRLRFNSRVVSTFSYLPVSALDLRLLFRPGTWGVCSTCTLSQVWRLLMVLQRVLCILFTDIKWWLLIMMMFNIIKIRSVPLSRQ